MISAYILLKVKPNKDRDVIRKIRQLPKAKEVTSVYGEYDLIVKVEAESLEDLDSVVFDSIRAIPEVDATTTCIATGKW
jgi:anthranilate phosphoribosyltransferase